MRKIYLQTIFLLMVTSNQVFGETFGKPSQIEGAFIGCASSLGECKNSCPQRNGFGWQDNLLCAEADLKFACHCPTISEEKPKDPDPAEYRFIGCVPTPSECRYSCGPNVNLIFQASNQCDGEGFGCFCKVGN